MLQLLTWWLGLGGAEGERGPLIDPDGIRGPLIDPDGIRGPLVDPNG